MNKIIQTNIKLLYVIFYSKRSKESINEKQGPTKEHIYVGALMDMVIKIGILRRIVKSNHRILSRILIL